MSTYYYIGCETCREDVAFVRKGMFGASLMGGADAEVPDFVDKHTSMGHGEALRIYSEHDQRNDSFSEFDPKVEWEVKP